MAKARKRIRNTNITTLQEEPAETKPLQVSPFRAIEPDGGDEGNGGGTEVTIAPASAVTPPTREAPPLTPRSIINAVTVEMMLYALILLAATLMRFSALGSRPLSEHEAANAVAAWQFLQGQAIGVIGSPLLFSVNALLFLLLSATDTTARIFPAVVGSAGVLLPVLFRKELGRAGAFASSIVILLSTSLVYFARDVSGAEIAVIAGITGFAWFWRYLNGGSTRRLYLSAIAFAISLTASSISYTLLLAGVVSLLFFQLLIQRGNRDLEANPGWGPNGADGSAHLAKLGVNRVDIWRAAGMFTVSYVALATAFLMNRQGLGVAFNLFTDWLSVFQEIGPLTSPLNLLLAYEPFALVFGTAGLLLVLGLERNEIGNPGLLQLSSGMSLVSLILYSLAGVKAPENVISIVLPLCILAGWFVGNLVQNALEQATRENDWRGLVSAELPILAAGLLLGPLLYLQFVSFLQRGSFSPALEGLRQLLAGQAGSAFEPAFILIGILGLLLIGFLVLVSVGTIGAARTANVGGVVVALLLMVSGVRALWLANYLPLDEKHELIATAQASEQARDLAHDIKWASQWRANDEHGIRVKADESLGPVVRWYLREFPNAEWVRSPKPDGIATVLLTRDDAPAPAGNWISQRYKLIGDWQLGQSSREQFFKWLAFREGGVVSSRYVRLWVTPPE